MSDSEKPKRKKARDGSGSARQRPDGLWEIRFSLPDGKRKSVYAPTYTEAKSKADSLKREIAQGRDVALRDPTVEAYLKDWYAFVDNGTRAPSTLINYDGHIRIHLVPAIGHLKLSKLTARHIDMMLRSMEAKKLSPRTRQKARITIRLALEQAMKWGHVARNVAEQSENPRLEPKERVRLTPEQLRFFIEETKDYRLNPLFALGIATGMRIGEILGLRWADVDLKNGSLRIDQALQKAKGGGFQIGQPKTPKSRRLIVLPKIAIDAIERQRVRQDEDRAWAGDKWVESGLVFTSMKGTVLDPSNVTHLFQRQLGYAGLPRIRFHDLRHGAATNWAAKRVPQNVVRDMLGHSSSRTTIDIYTHTDRAELQIAADMMDEVLTSDGKKAS